MVEIFNMFKINDIASVCLEKPIFGESFQPILHGMDRLIISAGVSFCFVCLRGEYGGQ